MFEVISHGGGAFIMQVLNGVAMMFGSGDYLYALKICATLSAMGILIGAAFSGRIPDLKWILVIFVVFHFAFLPKVDVTVTDTVERTHGVPTVRVAGNVPMGLAFVASFTSHMSDYFTRAFETVFSMPNEINYRGGGFLFAEAITENALRAKVRDPNLSMSLANFWHDCVFYDLGLSFYSMNDLSKAEDIRAFLSNNTAAGRAYEHIHDDGTKSFQICRESISSGGPLAAGLDAEIQKISHRIATQNDASGTQNMNSLVTTNSGAMPIAFTYLTKMSKTQTEILSQSIMANSFSDGLVAFANSADSASVVNGYIASKAEAERNSTFTVLGKLSARMLPMMKNIFEGIIYAMAPFVGMMMMFPGAAKVGLAYVMALVWISLWAPLFAIFHWAQSFFTAMAAEKAAEQCGNAAWCTGGSLSMYTMHGMVDVFTSSAAIAGYIAVSLPLIAYMLTNKSGAMAASLAGRVMDGYQAPVSKASSEAVAGNVSMGTVSMSNLSAFQQNTAPSNTFAHVNENDGRTMTSMTGSGAIHQMRVDSGPATLNAQSSLSSAISQQQTESTRARESAGASLTEASVNQFNTMLSAERAVSRGTGTGVGSGVDNKTSDSATFTNVSSAANLFAERAGVSKQYMDAELGQLGLGGNFKVASAGISQTAKNSEEYQKAAEAAKQFLLSADYRSAISQSQDAYEQETAGRKDEVANTGRNSIANSDAQVTTAQQNYSAAVEREQAVSRVAQDINTNSAAAGADLSGYLSQRLKEDGVNWNQFNLDVNNGNPAAMARLQSYTNDYARDYIEKAVTKTQGDVQEAGQGAVGNLDARANATVDAASGEGESKVNARQGATGTTAADGSQIQGKAANTEAKAADLRQQQGNAAAEGGANVEQKAAVVPAKGDDINAAVEERSDKAPAGQVAKGAFKQGVEAYNAGASLVDKGLERMGIDPQKASDAIFGNKSKDSDK